ncbi:hypothetical protein ACFYUY_04740 [Kitasatospora sp. NPDC004745]|uniref:hypothetical protein n=1 Tax=Kitasatospora sp. NPDC004745 TaxID=3364019 RepID=UPI00367980B5
MPVSHTCILTALDVLDGGAVEGRVQITRSGPVIITAHLHETIRQDVYDGVTVIVTTLAAGEIARNFFSFSQHSTLPKAENSKVTTDNHHDMAMGGDITPARLRSSVATYIAHFTESPAS